MPDQLPPALSRDRIEALHGAIRQWTAHIPQNLPYVDLLFAFTYAKLGESSAANKLLEDARKVMEVPLPALERQQEDPKVVSAVVTNFVFKAFKYRVDQALAGKPHAGDLSPELVEELEGIRKR